MNPRSSSRSSIAPTGVAVNSGELRIRFRDLIAGSGDVGELAGVFARLYRSQRWGKGEWAAFVMAEGLRVKDLDSQPAREVVGLFAGELVNAGLNHRDAGVVAGVSHRTAGRHAAIVRGAEVELSVQGFEESVVAEVLARNASEIAADPVSPENALILVEEQLRALPAHLSEYAECLSLGGPVGPGVDQRLRRILRELLNAVGTVQVYGRQRGVCL